MTSRKTSIRFSICFSISFTTLMHVNYERYFIFFCYKIVFYIKFWF